MQKESSVEFISAMGLYEIKEIGGQFGLRIFIVYEAWVDILDFCTLQTWDDTFRLLQTMVNF
jgi:hypothetical protein